MHRNYPPERFPAVPIARSRIFDALNTDPTPAPRPGVQRMLIAIKDETFAGDLLNEIELEFASELVTVRDIIEARVLEEVRRYNDKRPEYFLGLVEPSDAERTLNGFKLKGRRAVDGEKQVYVALDAFKRNAFFMLIDDRQAETLEEEVMLSKSSRISFVKLTPLVGG
jgi:hypothetical protein